MATRPATTAYLLLDVAGTTCALPRAAVREILPLPHLHAPPASGGPLAGFLNLSGTPVPVLDLARLLALREAPEPEPYRHLVLATDGATALLVDRVADLVTVPDHAVRPVEDAVTLNGCVEAELALGDRLVHALALPRLLTTEERARLDALTAKAAARLAALEPA